MHVGSWESTREAFEWHKVNSSASLHPILGRDTGKARTDYFRTLPLPLYSDPVHAKTQLFCYGYGYRPYVYNENDAKNATFRNALHSGFC